MGSKLKVDELRAQLYLRSLNTSGTKPILVRRLEEAILKEEKEKEASKGDKRHGTSNGSKKRRRGPEEDGSEGNIAIDRIQVMGIRELRKLTASHGMATNGSKSDLIDRVSAHMERSAEGTVEGDEVEGDNMEKLVTTTKKGGAVLDQWLPDSIKSRFHVLQHGGETYDAMLNQTNVGENNNKFYVIQALESDNGGTFMIYNRWGRVGVRGRDKLHGPYMSRENAICEFELKFYDKTKNHWSDRRDFTYYPRCYTLLEMDYGETEKAPVTSTDGSVDAQLRETKLDTRIAKFVSLICNINMMKQQMLEIGYNAEKLPLGKLSKSAILKGYDVLRRISDVMEKSDRKKLEQLSGEFYTVIPHDFGFKKMRQFVIDTPYKLKCKLEMVAALGEIEIATKILQDDAEIQDDPLHYHYQQLRCELIPVEACSQEFLMIRKYMSNTHAKTHSSYAVDIVQIFKVSRHGENERFAKFSNTKHRMLLWHGSRLTNWTGILSQGLRIAPPEAPVTGYMFGKGVYFADMFSKSANYCYASHESASGVLLLCEVALGDMSELLTADCNADRLPKGKLSTKGVGATAPDPAESHYLEDVIVPLGKPKERTGPKGSLLYNEYAVYNVDQIRMRYVVQVNFNFNAGMSAC